MKLCASSASDPTNVLDGAVSRFYLSNGNDVDSETLGDVAHRGKQVSGLEGWLVRRHLSREKHATYRALDTPGATESPLDDSKEKPLTRSRTHIYRYRELYNRLTVT